MCKEGQIQRKTQMDHSFETQDYFRLLNYADVNGKAIIIISSRRGEETPWKEKNSDQQEKRVAYNNNKNISRIHHIVSCC